MTPSGATEGLPPREVVLAVDDSEENLLLLEEYLLDWGYEVVLARDGREAIERFEASQPSLIVLDVMMPNLDGYEACRAIKRTAEGRGVPIVMLTALASTEEKIRALECGADDFLTKPIIRDELRTRIRSLIRVRALRRELDSSESIVIAFNSAIENKSRRFAGHSLRVARHAVLLCRWLGMSESDITIVERGALLHDLGIIGVADEILQNEDAFAHGELALLQAHATLGSAILGPLSTFRPVLSIVHSHHERFDGTGYPDGLAGDAIPVEARIVAIANRFDEIQHESSTPLSDAEALSRLESESRAGALDGKLLERFAQALRGERPAAAQAAPPVLAHLVSRPRVLVVDDMDDNRELIEAMLGGEGFELVPARNAEEAARILGAGEIDLVLLDLMMPGQSGIETLRTLRLDPQYEFLPVIVVTANGDRSVRQTAIVAGADDFLSYPLHRLELVTRIRSLLRISEYHKDVEKSQNVICALALALEAKDPYTRGHSQHVGDLACALAKSLGYSPLLAERLRIGGLLHDIGKIAVPEELLNKVGPLTKEEYLRVIDHPTIGEQMVRPLVSLRPILEIIRHHHERFDGRGYPDGLAGTEIPLEARLLSVVDAYDALTSNRAYRPGPLDHLAALETLQRESRSGKWDPVFVDALCSLLGAQPPDFAALSTPLPALWEAEGQSGVTARS
jgi:putative two-component system response regulator